MLVAAGKVDLELAGQVLAHRVAEEEPCNRLRVWRGIKGLVWADAGKVAAHYVSDGVAACLPGSQAGLDKPSHDLAYVLQLHPVELDVLAG